MMIHFLDLYKRFTVFKIFCCLKSKPENMWVFGFLCNQISHLWGATLPPLSDHTTSCPPYFLSFRAHVRELIVGSGPEQALLLLYWSWERVQFHKWVSNPPSGSSLQGDAERWQARWWKKGIGLTYVFLSHRMMLVDRGRCRRSGRPLPKRLFCVRSPDSFRLTSCRTCSPSGLWGAAVPQRPGSTASSPPTGEKTGCLFCLSPTSV